MKILRLAVALSLAAATTALAQPSQFKRFKVSPAQTQKGGDVRWEVAKGGRVEFEKDEYAILESDVKVWYQDIKVNADKVTINLKTKDVVAEGHVIIDQGPTRVTANQAVYNLDSKTGTFFQSTATMDPSMYFTGDKIEKIDEDTFRLTNGVFTSCEIDNPAWSFHVGHAEVTLDDYAHMRDISFRAADIPVFWSPRLVWPTKRDRSRGFLIPRVQFGNEDFGERLELGYFLPFGESADATINLDLNSKGYFGGGLNVRYLPSQNVKLGELDAFTVRDVDAKTDGNPATDEARMQWKYRYQHSQENLPGGFRGVVDIQDYSDLEFFRRWDRDPRLHTLSNIYSSAYLTKNRPTYSFNIVADRREIYLGRVNFADPSSPILNQRFEQRPSLQFRMYPQRLLGSPLYFSMESSTSQLRTRGSLNGPEADYFRADIFPTFSLQMRTPAWLSVKPQISARQTYYTQSIDQAAIDNPLLPRTAVDESLSRFYAQGQMEIVGPSFSKVFNRSVGGFTKFKHVIEPRFRYVYTTDVKEQARIIRFDTVDSPYLPIVQNSVEYSLTQRLIGKESGPSASPREVLSLSLRQTVALSDPFTSATTGGIFGTPADFGEHRFTPLTASLHVNPYQSLTLDATATFGNISHQIDYSSLSANLVGTGTRSDKYLSMTWFASYRDPRFPNVGGSSQLRVNTGSNIWRDKMRADIQINFDADQGKFLEQRYLIGRTGSCWGVALEYRRYLVYNPLEEALDSFHVAVSLKNVGTIGTH